MSVTFLRNLRNRRSRLLAVSERCQRCQVGRLLRIRMGFGLIPISSTTVEGDVVSGC